MRSENLVKMVELKNIEKLEKFNCYKGKIKIGILGGIFDFIYYVYLVIVEFIRDKYDIDKIIFILLGNLLYKLCIIIDKYDRYNMIFLVIESNEDFLVLKVEIERKKRIYIIDILKYLKKKYKNVDIYFIIGVDVICSVEEWKDVKKNFELVIFIVVIRLGISLLRL